MKKQAVYTLINNQFTAAEAKAILTSMYTAKIDFHAMKQFSAQERYGTDDAMAVTKLPALKETLATIKQLMDEAEAAQSTVNIQATIDISFEPTSIS
ncbi:hypothetical protein ACFOWM_12235 [Ferruginibacter yonginensis]|uniref:Uncharacterized protein n=1 Tax=Ferruginibacter yonginensis TaxID=1310416 RepID=A0ABV8QXF6_9BACT